jgi:site-specific DNA recombinase
MLPVTTTIEGTMRAAIYARFSSDLQSPTSIADQARDCRARAEQLGADVVEVYADAALSGADARHRPALQRMLADARDGRFDVVISEALDRISRDQEDTAAIFKRLSFAGVRLLTLAEGDVSELHVGLRGTMNALYLRDLAQKVRRGQRGRVEAGKNPGGICYGYRAAPRLGERGELERGIRAIDEREAAVVRRIFAAFIDGASPIDIAAGLNAERVPAPRGGIWRSGTIRGHGPRATGILRNPIYAGRVTWNRQTFMRDPETGKRVPRVTPAEARLSVEDASLAIVDAETWSRAQARLTAVGRPGAGPRRGRRPKHLLTGLVVCATCGGQFGLHGADRFRCRTYTQGRACSNRKTVRLGDLTRRVLAGLRESLLSPEALREFVAEYRAAVAKRRSGAAQRALARERELADLARRQKQIMELVETGAIGDARATIERLREIERRQDELRRPEPELDRVELMPRLPEICRRAVDALLAADVPPSAAAEIRGLIDRIVIHPDDARGAYRAELVGTLANLLTPENRRATVEGEMMVAAGRFELPTKGL